MTDADEPLDDPGPPPRPIATPDDPWVLHLVARVERPPAGPPPAGSVLAAAARAVVALLHDERAKPGGPWADDIADWEGVAIRKVARRARGAAWLRAAAEDGVLVGDGEAEAVALPPTLRSMTPPTIDPLQVGGLDLGPPPLLHEALEAWGVAAAGGGVATPLVLVVASVGMSTGKALAQVGHGAQLADRRLAAADRAAWAAAGWPVVVATVVEADWPTVVRSALAVVHDAGHTEVAPGTATVAALPWPAALDVAAVLTGR